MKAIFPGTCSVCGGTYVPRTDEIDYTGKSGPRGGKLTAHVKCLGKKMRKNTTSAPPLPWMREPYPEAQIRVPTAPTTPVEYRLQFEHGAAEDSYENARYTAQNPRKKR